MGSWKADSPASPHKLLNAFVENMADFTPPDGDESILAQEEVPHLIEIPTFDWSKLRRGKSYDFIGWHQVILL